MLHPMLFNVFASPTRAESVSPTILLAMTQLWLIAMPFPGWIIVLAEMNRLADQFWHIESAPKMPIFG